MTKVRPASERQLRAFHLRTQLEISYQHYADWLGCKPYQRPADLGEYVTVAIPVKLLEEIHQYLSEDEPKSIWQLPQMQQSYKEWRKETEAKLTLDELAKARGIQVASAERRIKRRRK
jgi:hypothetical protein